MSLVVIGLSICFLLGAASPFFPLSVWPLELLSHFQAQYMAGGLVLLALSRDMRVSAALIAGLLLCAVSLSPFFIGRAKGVDGASELKIIQVNVYKFNEDKAGMVQWLLRENPDLVVAAEVTPDWARVLEGLHGTLPHRFESVREGSHGMAVYSRYALTAQDILYPDGNQIPALSFDVGMPGKTLAVLSLHPSTPMTRTEAAMRDLHFDLARRWAAERLDRPAVVLGDLNVTSFSPAYKAMMAGTELRNAREGFGLFPSWPADFPSFLRIPIDHVLCNGLVTVHSFMTGPVTSSDHLPTVTHLAF